MWKRGEHPSPRFRVLFAMLFCSPTGPCLWPLFHEDRSVPDPVAPAVLATLSHWENTPQLPVVDLAVDLGEMCPCSGHRGVALLLHPAWGHPRVTREVPHSCVHWSHAHMYRGGGCQGACVWASGGWQLPGQWVSCPPPFPSPMPAQTCSQGSDVGSWPRGSSRSSVGLLCPRPACWGRMSIRRRDAGPRWDPGLLLQAVGIRHKNELFPGLRPCAGECWEPRPATWAPSLLFP